MDLVGGDTGDGIAEEIDHYEIDDKQDDKRSVIILVIHHRIIQQEDEEEGQRAKEGAKKRLGELRESRFSEGLIVIARYPKDKEPKEWYAEQQLFEIVDGREELDLTDHIGFYLNTTEEEKENPCQQHSEDIGENIFQPLSSLTLMVFQILIHTQPYRMMVTTPPLANLMMEDGEDLLLSSCL